MNIISCDTCKEILIGPYDVFDIHRTYDEMGRAITTIIVMDNCKAFNNLDTAIVKTFMPLIPLMHGFILEFAEAQNSTKSPNTFIVALKQDFKALKESIKNVFKK